MSASGYEAATQWVQTKTSNARTSGVRRRSGPANLFGTFIRGDMASGTAGRSSMGPGGPGEGKHGPTGAKRSLMAVIIALLIKAPLGDILRARRRPRAVPRVFSGRIIATRC